MKIETLEQALSLVPEYFPLVPGVDQWRKGDQWGEGHTRTRWSTITDASFFGQVVDGLVSRRPIPQEIRLQEARAYLWEVWRGTWSNGEGEDNDTPTIMFEPTHADDYDFLDYDSGCRRDSQRVGELGNAMQICQAIQGRGTLWRWVAENRGWHS